MVTLWTCITEIVNRTLINYQTLQGIDVNIENQKNLHESGEWVIVHNPIKLGLQHEPSWRIVDNFDCIGDYKLIHQKHKHILEAYLNGCEVHCPTNKPGMSLETHFIEDYCSTFYYYAVPKTLENCYCLTSKLHYDKLIKAGKQTHLETSDNLVYVMYDGFPNSAFVYTKRGLSAEKQIEYDTQLQKWVYCPKEAEMNNITQPTTSEHLEQQYEDGTLFEIDHAVEEICNGCRNE